MKRHLKFSVKYGALALLTFCIADQLSAERIVILHTNDTHSQIDPDRYKGTGGILRRKAAVDSVRQAERNVLLVDAGDAVQGSLYFTLFGGEVEQKMMNQLGYDVQILGNHEFDNGLDQLAGNYRNATPTIISTNYDVESTPIAGQILPYVIKQTGRRRIGFIGINIEPDGLISPARSEGIRYLDGLEAATKMSAWLRDSAGVDAVVALTHIGYTPERKGYTDPDLANKCPGIDVIIGGHTHTPLTPEDPRTRIVRSPGDTVLVVQNAKGGHFLGKVVLDFGDDGHLTASWDRIAIDRRLDANIDQVASEALAPYREQVDSIYSIPVTIVAEDFGLQAMMNFAADLVLDLGKRLVRDHSVDFAIINKGGIRQRFAAGGLSRGEVIDVFPFDNRVVVLDLCGSELTALFDLMARQKGQGVSANVDAVATVDGSGCSSVTIDGHAIDPKRIYRIATIDYLAEGGDNMSALRKGKIIAASKNVLYNDVISNLSLRSSRLIPDNTIRMK